MYSEKPGGAKVFFGKWLKEVESGIVGLFYAEVVSEMGDEAGEELKFFVVGGLLLRCFEGVESRQKT
jgi:hypothetical protein